jgi:hypothetical protein
MQHITLDMWKLFVGLDSDLLNMIFGDPNKSSLNFHDYERLITWFQSLSPNDIDVIQGRRETYRIQYTGDYDWRMIDIDGVLWAIHKLVPVPWMVPTKYHWHNSKAVKPSEASEEEMLLCGKLIPANYMLFQRFKFYRNIIPMLVELESCLFPNDDFVELATHWDQGMRYSFYNPAFKVICMPLRTVGYGMLLYFEKDFIDRNTDKIVVPANSKIVVAAGEIRPLDTRSFDNMAFRQQKSARDTHLVFTNCVGYRNRPGVGNSVFIANCTCQDPNFKIWWAPLGFKQKNIIVKTDYAYKHQTLRAAKDITGLDVKTWSTAYTQKGHVTDITIGDGYLFPVEFVYDKESKSRERGGHKFTCQCLSRCALVGDEDKNVLDLYREPSFQPRTTPIEQVIREAKHPKILQNYVAQFESIGPGFSSDSWSPSTPKDEATVDQDEIDGELTDGELTDGEPWPGIIQD